MKLLPRTEIKKIQNEETTRLVKERAVYSDAAVLEVRKFNETKSEMKKQMELLADSMLAEQNELLEKRAEVLDEISSLEGKKKTLIAELSLYNRKSNKDYKEIAKKYNEAVALLEKIKEKNRLLEADSAQVTVNLSKTAIALQEADNARSEAEAVRASALEAERASLEAQAEKLSVLNKREEALIYNAKILTTERQEIDLEKKSVKAMLEELATKENIIAHKEQMLANAFAEAKKKGLL